MNIELICGDSMAQMYQVQEILGNNFRIIPAGRSKHWLKR